MTLLLASVTECDIVVTADGLSTSDGAPGQATLQKVFQVSPHCIAIAQCGPNFLKTKEGEVGLTEWLPRFFRDYENAPGNVARIARRVHQAICDDETEVAREKQFFNKGAELWIIGYSSDSDKPEFFRVTKEGCEDLIDERTLPFKKHTGSGGDFLRCYDWHDQNEAWLVALGNQSRQEKEPVFGGHRHRLHITPTSCKWVSEPVRGTLGLEMTLGRWCVGTTMRKSGAFGDQTIDPPRARIKALREKLVKELGLRATKPNGKHPRTYGGAKEHWRCDSQPNWDLTDSLLAANDDAQRANPGDVSLDDVQLYEVLVRQVIESLPAAG